MRKIFLGCGCLVLVLVGAFGFLALRLGPLIEQQEEAERQVHARLLELDGVYPFAANQGGELDPQRFARALQARETLARRLREEEDARRESEGDGFLDLVPNLVARVNGVLGAIPEVLEAHELGPSELAYHSRLVWAALETAAAGAGGPELVPLGRRHAELVGAWDFMTRNNPNVPSLESLVDTPAAPIVLAARDVLAAQPDRAAAGLCEPAVEGLLLGLPDIDQRFIEAYSGQRIAELAQRAAGEP